MACKHIGKQTVLYDFPPCIASAYSVVGEKEGEGPYGLYFDEINMDPMFGGKTWEEAESNLVKTTCTGALNRFGSKEVDYVIGGDLLGQLMGTTFGVAQFNLPFLGIYGACSTMGEALIIGSMIINGGFGSSAMLVTSSHFGGAEKQFRAPLNYGAWRTLTSSYTVTGSGAIILKNCQCMTNETDQQVSIMETDRKILVKGFTAGVITDFGVKDSMNMGGAMAPAAAATIKAHFKDTNKRPGDYDLIITGDLGRHGSELLIDLLAEDGYDISCNHFDCGDHMFSEEQQDTHAGGSGPGCCASMLCGYFIKAIAQGTYKNILFVPTGALLSPVSFKEGKTVPSIAHAVILGSD